MGTIFRFLLILTFSILSVKTKAQFYTITADNTTSKFVNESNEKQQLNLSNITLKKQSEVSVKAVPIDYFSLPEGKEIRIEKSVPVFVNMTDSLLMGLIKQRLNVCLPLDFLKVNSEYGTRVDPVQKCSKFHDGIDFKCNHEYVYAMLPGIIKTVHYGNKGYGNYVVIDYGNIESLYGHLSLISVKEGDVVNAGTIVGVSGNSGKSTGPHLHLRLRKNGKSVNPAPFISYLNRYITGLQDKIAYLRFGSRPPQELTIKNLYKVLDKYNISNQSIVVAQALLETGYFSSRVCLEENNLFGLRKPSTGEYYSFKNWEESVRAYRDYVQYKYKGGDYFQFLEKIGYAEDKNYLSKVKAIAISLNQL